MQTWKHVAALACSTILACGTAVAQQNNSARTTGTGNAQEVTTATAISAAIMAVPVDTTTSSVARDSSAQPSDAELTRRVERVLGRRGGAYGGIDVQVANGIVTLSGSVDSLLHKRRAEDLVSGTRGVFAVRNAIVVSAPDVSSDEITSAARRALTNVSQLKIEDLRVSAQSGVIELNGKVPSDAQRRLAEAAVIDIRGVKGVINNLRVEPGLNRTAEEIRREVENTLRVDRLVEEENVDVKVDGSKVVLSGTVDSVASKQQVIRDAWVEGVTEVDPTGLKVNWQVRKQVPPANVSRGEQQQASLAADVRQKLKQEPRVDLSRVSIDATSDTITLSGTVATLEAKYAAGRAARDVENVRRVVNNLRVRSDQPKTDAQLEQDLRDAMINSVAVESYEVDADVQNGVATLTGNVDSYTEWWAAGERARRVPGVRQVKNNIEVREPLSRASNYMDDPAYYDYYSSYYGYYPYDDTYDHPSRGNNYGEGWPWESDAEIKEDIEEEFFWSPFVDGGDITVTVTNGAATLTGSVDSYRELGAAAENAREGGAVTVVNNLVVRPGR